MLSSNYCKKEQRNKRMIHIKMKGYKNIIHKSNAKYYEHVFIRKHKKIYKDYLKRKNCSTSVFDRDRGWIGVEASQWQCLGNSWLLRNNKHFPFHNFSWRSFSKEKMIQRKVAMIWYLEYISFMSNLKKIDSKRIVQLMRTIFEWE